MDRIDLMLDRLALIERLLVRRDWRGMQRALDEVRALRADLLKIDPVEAETRGAAKTRGRKVADAIG